MTALSTAVRKEIRKICSDSHDSILRMKTETALELFSWERVWLEAAVVLKAGHATKQVCETEVKLNIYKTHPLQVFTRLHSLSLCKTLSNVLDEASVGHDEKVCDWQDAQNETLSAPQLPVVSYSLLNHSKHTSSFLEHGNCTST